MTTKTLATLTAVILSAAGVMEAQVVRVQIERRPEPRIIRVVPQPRRMVEVRVPVARPVITYYSSPGVMRIHPSYFAANFGRIHWFHMPASLTVFRGETYFNWHGAWFGISGVVPPYWSLRADSLFIDLGADGNYYLYNARFPERPVMLTYVENVGDDQTTPDQN